METDDEAEAEAWEFSDRDVDDLPAQEVGRSRWEQHDTKHAALITH